VSKRVPDELSVLLPVLLGAIADVRRGAMEPRTATALATLSVAVVKIYGVVDIAERVRTLEGR
jgi:hypothetical protein